VTRVRLFARAVAEAYPYWEAEALTHLKLQKLVFYAYGFCAAESLLDHEVTFEAWKHGPVSPEIYDWLAGFGSKPLPKPPTSQRESNAGLRRLQQVVQVYGRLTAWQLVEESHTEAPWKNAHRPTGEPSVIANRDIVEHFTRKLVVPRLPGAAARDNAALDGIPSARFATFDQLCAFVATCP
jgi:uncharacterized phage-associated protein